MFPRGRDTVESFLSSYRDDYIRVEFWGDRVDRITRRDSLTNAVLEELPRPLYLLAPQAHFVHCPQAASIDVRRRRGHSGRTGRAGADVRERKAGWSEAQRLHPMRTMYDPGDS
jgi:excinuclease UvrABC helicase subunit UvrB